MTKIVNLTPHPIFVLDDELMVTRAFPVSMNPARTSRQEEFHLIDGVIVASFTNLKVVNLPEPDPDMLFIVSRIVKQTLPERNDLLIPAHPYHNDEGAVVGCKSFEL